MKSLYLPFALLFSLALLVSCNNDQEDPGSGPDPDSGSQEVKSIFTIDGTVIDLSASNPEGANLSSSRGQARSFPDDTLLIKHTYTVTITKLASTETSIQIKYYVDESVIDHELDMIDSTYYRKEGSSLAPLFSEGAIDLSRTEDSGDHGTVAIIYNDGVTSWSSEQRSGDVGYDQSGSSLTVDEVSTEDMTNDHSFFIRLKGSCTLYDNAGNSVSLTDGEFSGIIQEFFMAD